MAPNVAQLELIGNEFKILYDDGTTAYAVPTMGSIWLVTSNEDPTTPPTPGGGAWIWPFPLAEVTYEFRPPDRPTHNGMDFSGAVARENAPTPCTGAGVVIVANNTQNYGGYGNAVVVDHGNVGPSGEKVFSLYGHMAPPGPVVRVGDTVTPGQNLGPLGNTGRSFGAHSHFEIMYGSPLTTNSVNPRTFLATKGI